MSRGAIRKTVEKMRSATDAGMSEMMFRKDAIRVVHQFADQVEADVADIIAENERLKKELAETKEAMKPIDDVYIPDYGICDTCYDRSECKGYEHCEWHDIVEAVQKAKSIIGGWSWTRISEKG